MSVMSRCQRGQTRIPAHSPGLGDEFDPKLLGFAPRALKSAVGSHPVAMLAMMGGPMAGDEDDLSSTPLGAKG